MPMPLARAALLAALLALAACAPRPGGDPAAVGQGGPDEFLVLPTRPLELPDDITALPQPSLGSANRVDRRPNAEAVVALSGSPVAGTGGGAALVAEVGPVAPGIRSVLAQEDALYRRENRGRPLERLLGSNREGLIYRRMLLDAQAEAARLRAAGIYVPPAPPPPAG